MKNFRKVCAAVLLTLAIAVPTFPGEISCPCVSAYHEHSVNVSGEISCPGVTSEPAPETSPETTALDPVTSFTTGLLQSLMSLF